MKPESFRRSLYPLLITVAAAAIAGRILNVVRVYEPNMYRDDPGQTAASVAAPLAGFGPAQTLTLLAAGQERWSGLDPDAFPRVWPRTRPEPMPTFGANDRSRWATVRALVDEGTFVIGHRDIDPVTGEYRDRGIVTEDGWGTIDMVLHPERKVFLSSKPPLLTTLVAGEYWLLKKLFGLSITRNRWLVIRTGLVTVNLLPFVVYLLLLGRLAERYGRSDWGRLYVFAAGCFGTFLTTFAITLNNHSPAAYCALFALFPALHILGGDGDRFGSYVVAGFFAGLTASMELPATAFLVFLFLMLLVRSPRRALLGFAPAAAVPVAALLFTNWLAVGMLRPAYSQFGTEWYDYAGSHWNPPPERRRGIDWAGLQESRAVYAFNLLIGHHGLFSLSPIWLLAVAGMIAAVLRLRKTDEDWPRELKWAAALALALTLVLLTFYISRGERMRNYGGFSSGPRWLFWMTPLWLVSMFPVADWLARRRWGRGLALVLLAFSVLSVSFPAWNPWRHPWIYQLIEYQGWLRY